MLFMQCIIAKFFSCLFKKLNTMQCTMSIIQLSEAALFQCTVYGRLTAHYRHRHFLMENRKLHDKRVLEFQIFFSIARSFGEGRVQVSIGAFWDLFHVLMNRVSNERALHQI